MHDRQGMSALAVIARRPLVRHSVCRRSNACTTVFLLLPRLDIEAMTRASEVWALVCFRATDVVQTCFRGVEEIEWAGYASIVDLEDRIVS